MTTAAEKLFVKQQIHQEEHSQGQKLEDLMDLM
jgi:hypothetical protein